MNQTTVDDISVVHINENVIRTLKDVLDFLGWSLDFRECSDKNNAEHQYVVGFLTDKTSNQKISYQYLNKYLIAKSGEQDPFLHAIRSMPVIMNLWLKKQPAYKHDKLFVASYCLELLQHGLVWKVGNEKIIRLPKFKSLSELKMKLEIMNGDQKI